MNDTAIKITAQPPSDSSAGSLQRGNKNDPPKNQNVRLSMPQLLSLAIKQQKHGEHAQAIDLYKTYLQQKPNDVSAWSNMGAAFRQLQRYELAVGCYQRGLAIEPDNLAILGNLANSLKDLHRLDESIAIHQKLVERQSDNVQALMNYACALRCDSQFENALKQLERAQKLAPENAGIEWERAQNLLHLGRYAEGFQTYEARWRTGDLAIKEFPCPQWRGESLTDKTLVLHSEQGYGDTILAARCIPLIRASTGSNIKILLHCKKELHRLFAKVGADQLIDTTVAANSISADFHCPLMSLFSVLNITTDTIPPPATLHVPAECREKFARIIKKEVKHQLNIGIVWSGSLTFANNHNRALALDAFFPLLEIPNVRLFSLQKGPRANDLYQSGADAMITDLAPNIEDFADTAAAVHALDIIVMTDSSVAHLAASLGKPVINLLEKVPYWLYGLDHEKTPWYGSMQLVKQDEAGHWGTVIKKAKVTIEKIWQAVEV